MRGTDRAAGDPRQPVEVTVLALPADAVDGVRTVNEAPLPDPAGPGKLVDHVRLGTGWFGPVPPAEFGTGALGTLRAGVLAARPHHADEVTRALDRPVREDEWAFAFVVEGCQVGDVILVLGPEHITAAAVRPVVPVGCAAPHGATLTG